MWSSSYCFPGPMARSQASRANAFQPIEPAEQHVALAWRPQSSRVSMIRAATPLSGFEQCSTDLLRVDGGYDPFVNGPEPSSERVLKLTVAALTLDCEK